MTPEQVERNNRLWWDRHSPDYPVHASTALDVTGQDFPPGRTPYGRFIYLPLPVTGQTLWGFKTEAGRDLFLADVKAGKLPRISSASHVLGAPKLASAPAPAATVEDDFDILGEPEPTVAPQRAVNLLDDADDDFDILSDEPAATPAAEDDFDILGDEPDDDEDGWRE